MTDRTPAREETAPRATNDGSRGIGLRPGDFGAAMRRTPPPLLLVTALGLAAGLMVIVSQFLPIASIDLTNQAPCNEISDDLRGKCSLSGFEKHSIGLLLVGLVGLLMAVGAGIGGSRPAAFALVALGLLVVLLSLLIDLPETQRDGLVRDFTAYEAEDAKTGVGFYLELVSACLMVAAGALRLTHRE